MHRAPSLTQVTTMAYSESKANKRASIASISTVSSTSSTSSSGSSASSPQQTPLPRRESSIQLIPHSRTPAYFDQPLTLSEQELVAETERRFDDLDLSSQDFDFDDVFTFDRPQRKIPRVVEVSTPTRERGPSQRDWSNFSFSHYGAAANTRVKGHQYRMKPGLAGMQRELGLGIGAAYLRNQQALHRERK